MTSPTTSSSSPGIYADELIRLEKSQKERPFPPQIQQRWEELVSLIFKEDSEQGRKRRSFRLPSHTKCRVRANNQTFDFELFEMSLVGFTFIGNVFKDEPKDFIFDLSSVQVLGVETPIQVQCRRVRSISAEGGFRLGAEITNSNTSSQLDAYFQKIYYPFYMKYLESLTSNQK